MIYVLVALLVVALGAIGFLVTKKGGPSPAAPTRNLPPIEEEEGTQVRIMGHRLVRLVGGLKVGNEIPVVGVVSIGRDRDCTLSLQDPEMSNKHAEVAVSGDKAYLTDVGSTNGVLLNSERVEALTPVALNDGDQIKLGGTTLLYKSRAS